ncbi:MAG TPA: hypothetical protein VKP88_06615 [Candidatus Paceibacterota bacterium]|nr:hypothetical protein [Candidatus Paceibacterota bacterium]
MPDQHHAYVYLGTDVSVLPTMLQQQGADVVHLHLEQWGIEDSRRLAEGAAQRPVTAAKRSFVIVTNTLTHEAQNALLKLFEDPPETAVFYLVIPSSEMLLETVRSRVSLIRDSQSAPEASVWHALAAQPVAVQLAECAERAKAKDTSWQQAILAAAAADTTVPPAVRLLIETYRTRSGASRKMLIEEVILALASAR